MPEDLAGLLADVDAQAARLTDAHRERLRCQKGCTACCRQPLSVPSVEAAHILSWLLRKGIPDHDPAPTAADDHPLFDALSGDQPCVFLTAGGACGIYPVRPLVCRVHGLPLRLADGRVDACPMNFDGDPSSIAPLDLEGLHRRLAIVERRYCAQEGQRSGRLWLSQVRDLALEIAAEGL